MGRRIAARRHQLIWLGVAAYAALDGVPTPALHPPLAFLAVALAAV